MTLHLRTTPIASCALAAWLGHALAAQSPPPSGPVSIVGTANQTQSGGPAGVQRIGAICAPAFYRAAAPVGQGGVGLGGSICWWSEALHPTTVPLTLHAAGTCITVFGVAPFLFTNIPLPFAAPGFHRLFVPPTALLLPAPWTQTLTSGGAAVIPPGGYDRWFLTVDLPNTTALVGTVWTAQAARIDPSNLLIYLSDEYIVQVWL